MHSKRRRIRPVLLPCLGVAVLAAATQVNLTTEMITESDGAAATTLRDEVGMTSLRSFLSLAKMTHTKPGQDGYWGLSEK